MVSFHKLSRPIIAIVTTFVVVIAGAGIAYAANQPAIVQGNTDHTIYEAGRDVNITGTVNGDIFCAGQNVTIDAEVYGDVLCAGQTMTIFGKVHGNVRAAGQTVTIGAKVDRNVSLTGQDITLQNNTHVGRDASIAGQTITLNSAIGRDVDAGANTVTVNGSVGRKLNIRASNKLVLQNNAKVGGEINYTSPHMLEKAQRAQVIGSVNHYHELARRHNHNHNGWKVLWLLYWLVAMAVLAVVLVALFPQVFRRWNVVASEKFGYVLLTGFLAMFAVPVIAIALFSTVVGVPIGILVLLLWIAAMFLSGPLAMYYVGTRITPRLHPILVVLIGAVILGAIELIPIIGWLVALLAYWLGTGTLLWNLQHAYKKPDYATN